MATTIDPVVLFAFFAPQRGTAHQVASYESDQPGEKGLTVDATYGQGIDDIPIDGRYLNRSGADIAAGDWVVRDVGAIPVGGPSPLTGDWPAEYCYKSAKKSPASADGAGCLGVAMEAIPNGETGMIRRRGLIVPSVHGVTPKITGGVTNQIAVRLQLSGTEATAEAAGANTESMVGVALQIATEVAVEVRCL